MGYKVINGNNEKAQDLRGLTMMVLALSGLGGSIISGWLLMLWAYAKQ
jgi:hypothetical protein